MFVCFVFVMVLFVGWFVLFFGWGPEGGGRWGVGRWGGGGGDKRLAMTMVIETNGRETTLLTRYACTALKESFPFHLTRR